MHIGILHFTSRTKGINKRKLPTNIKLLKAAIIKMGHTPKIIRADKCQMYFTRKHPKVLYRGKSFPKVDVIIPKVTTLHDTPLRASLLYQLELINIPLTCNFKSVVSCKNKLRTAQLLNKKGVPVPITIMLERLEYLDIAIKKVGGFPIIIKTPYGSFGKGVVIVESRRSLHSALDMLWTTDHFASLLIQEYVEEAKGKDIRAFIIDGKFFAAMERSAPGDDFRSNLSGGGNGSIIKLTKKEIKIAEDAAEAMDLKIAGVDLLRSKHGPVVMEVNANPGLKGITETTGLDIASEIVKYAIKIAEEEK